MRERRKTKYGGDDQADDNSGDWSCQVLKGSFSRPLLLLAKEQMHFEHDNQVDKISVLMITLKRTFLERQ